MTTTAIETETLSTSKAVCDGGQGGHPRVWLQIPADKGFVDCPYCEKRFELAEGAGNDH